jgi:hypothetical protein
MDRKGHWERVYQTKAANVVSFSRNISCLRRFLVVQVRTRASFLGALGS